MQLVAATIGMNQSETPLHSTRYLIGLLQPVALCTEAQIVAEQFTTARRSCMQTSQVYN